MKVRFEASFEKYLKRVRDKKLFKGVREVIDEIKKVEDLNEVRNLKKLKGYETFYRIREL